MYPICFATSNTRETRGARTPAVARAPPAGGHGRHEEEHPSPMAVLMRRHRTTDDAHRRRGAARGHWVVLTLMALPGLDPSLPTQPGAPPTSRPGRISRCLPGNDLGDGGSFAEDKKKSAELTWFYPTVGKPACERPHPSSPACSGVKTRWKEAFARALPRRRCTVRYQSTPGSALEDAPLYFDRSPTNSPRRTSNLDETQTKLFCRGRLERRMRWTGKRVSRAGIPAEGYRSRCQGRQ